jgi:hypothetical protein
MLTTIISPASQSRAARHRNLEEIAAIVTLLDELQAKIPATISLTSCVHITCPAAVGTSWQEQSRWVDLEAAAPPQTPPLFVLASLLRLLHHGAVRRAWPATP